ncbi:hypothetical protein DXG01_005396 [Tephrocybe rancida]|nr:hypothetical protein DXG01_005396 [Tephrocybe rancida]
MHKCSFPGCEYQCLQKSNLATHTRTQYVQWLFLLNELINNFPSTGDKPFGCPDCEFCTGDPGSLTRHRKNRHSYIPKSTRKKARATESKKSHTLYKRPGPTASSSTRPPNNNSRPFTYPKEKSLSSAKASRVEASAEFAGRSTSALLGLRPAAGTCSQLDARAPSSSNITAPSHLGRLSGVFGLVASSSRSYDPYDYNFIPSRSQAPSPTPSQCSLQYPTSPNPQDKPDPLNMSLRDASASLSSLDKLILSTC